MVNQPRSGNGGVLLTYQGLKGLRESSDFQNPEMTAMAVVEKNLAGAVAFNREGSHCQRIAQQGGAQEINTPTSLLPPVISCWSLPLVEPNQSQKTREPNETVP